MMLARRLLDFAVFAVLAAMLVFGVVRARDEAVHTDVHKYGTGANHQAPALHRSTTSAAPA